MFVYFAGHWCEPAAQVESSQHAKSKQTHGESQVPAGVVDFSIGNPFVGAHLLGWTSFMSGRPGFRRQVEGRALARFRVKAREDLTLATWRVQNFEAPGPSSEPIEKLKL